MDKAIAVIVNLLAEERVDSNFSFCRLAEV